MHRPGTVGVVVVLLAAALLVVYLQHRSLTALDQQTEIIFEKVAEQTSRELAEQIRAHLDGPVFDTLTAVNHPELWDGPLNLIAGHYDVGLSRYPQVERFFVWNRVTEKAAPGEVVFHGHTPANGASPVAVLDLGRPTNLWRDPEFGAHIYQVARQHAGAQQIYAAEQHVFGGKTYDVFIRLFWTDAERDEFFALLGFVVCNDTAPQKLFPALYARTLAHTLAQITGDPAFELRVVDAQGHPVFGPADPLPAIRGSTTFSALYYPGEQIKSRLAAGIPAREWSVIVGVSSAAAARLLPSAGEWSYLLSGVTVLLMVVAVALIVVGDRRSSALARMQNEFVSHVSHQLKTPLALLTAATETLALERVRSPEKVAQYVEILRSETARLALLTERILEFSRGEDGRRQYEFEPVALGALVRDTVTAFSEKVAKDFSIRLAGSDAGPLVLADPAAIEQVVVNLLDNGVKYSRDDKSLEVRVVRAGPQAVIEVEDHGVGIQQAEHGRIFERFYRGSQTASHRRGFGLGLAIVKEIVTAHRGSIGVDSVPGRGSTFRVRLPVLHGGVAEAWQGAQAGATEVDDPVAPAASPTRG
jgi:signal transduction histidine kinase